MYSFSYQISQGPKISCMNHFHIHVSPEVPLDLKALKLCYIPYIYNKFTKDVSYSLHAFKSHGNILVGSVNNSVCKSDVVKCMLIN